MKKLYTVGMSLLFACLALNAQAAKKVILDDLSSEQVEASKRVKVGEITCEFNQKVKISAHEKEGYFNLNVKSKDYVVYPVLTTTGAVRLENAKDGLMWLQIANKSMLMDTKKQKRIIDNCINE